MQEFTITRKNINNEMERKLALYCITNDKVLQAIAKIYKPHLAKNNYTSTVINWCINHYNIYGIAPKEHITDIYINYKANLDTDQADAVGTFLHSIDDEFDKTPHNIDYLIDNLTQYLRLRAIETLKQELEHTVNNADVVGAERLITNFSKISVSSHETVNFTELSAGDISTAFDTTNHALIKLPGALGNMVGTIKATDFFHIVSPAKMGKSFFMQWVGIHAMVQGRNVLEISLEVPKDQRIRRFWQAVNCSPKEDGDVGFKYFTRETERDKFTIGERKEYRKAVDYSESAVKEFYENYRMQYPTGNYKLQCHISKTMSIRDLRTILTDMQMYHNYPVDVLILDHPALLSYGGRGQQSWEAIGDMYAELRGLATEYNLALVTASHSTRDSYKSNIIDETHVGKSIDILNHITTGISITSTKAEKDAGFYRASQLVERDGRVISDQVIITHCLDCALPHTDSRYLGEVDYFLPETKDNKKDS